MGANMKKVYIYNIFIKKSFDINGNPKFNLKIIEIDNFLNKTDNITHDFFKNFDFKKEKINYLKNGTINFFQYESLLKNKIEAEIKSVSKESEIEINWKG